MAGNHKRLVTLFAHYPYCYWCGCSVIYVKYQYKRKPQNNWATVDHLRSRLNSERGKDYNESTVLSCWKCNNDRAKKENDELSMEEKWLRSGKYPVIINT